MSIPRKGSRKIEVPELGKFRYLIKEKSRCDSTCENPYEDRRETELHITIQEDKEEPGNVLQVKETYACSISPAMIRDIITDATKRGWVPSKKGPAFRG